MLGLIYQSEPWEYLTGQTNPSINQLPWQQTNARMAGCFTRPTPAAVQTPTAETSVVTTQLAPVDTLYVVVGFDDAAHAVGAPYSYSEFSYDPLQGNLLGRTDVLLNYPCPSFFPDTNGIVYSVVPPGFGSPAGLYPFDFTNQSVPLSGGVLASDFGLTQFTAAVGIDRQANQVVQGSGNSLQVYDLTAKRLLVQFYMPTGIAQIALIGGQQAYVLCTNGVLILFNYGSGTVVNAFDVQPDQGGQWLGR